MRIAIFGFVIMRDTLPLSVENRRGQKWDHYLVVPREGEPASASSNRPAHNISQRTILLNEIEVRCEEILECESEVANDGHGLQKDFGQHDRGPEIQVHTPAVEFTHKRTQQAEIMQAGLADAAAD